jgi:hypothetical protein
MFPASGVVVTTLAGTFWRISMAQFIKIDGHFFDSEQVDYFHYWLEDPKKPHQTQLEVYLRGHESPITFHAKKADAVFAKLKQIVGTVEDMD